MLFTQTDTVKSGGTTVECRQTVAPTHRPGQQLELRVERGLLGPQRVEFLLRRHHRLVALLEREQGHQI